jgi:hypothetical protein
MILFHCLFETTILCFRPGDKESVVGSASFGLGQMPLGPIASDARRRLEIKFEDGSKLGLNATVELEVNEIFFNALINHR